MNGQRPTGGASGFLRRAIAPAAFALAVLVAWQLYIGIADVPESSLPAPTEIAAAGWEDRQLLVDNMWVTIAEILLGFAIAIAGGLLLALAIRSSRAVERAVYPWLVVSQMVPVPAIAPIFVIWAGFDLRPEVMVVALVAFFPIVVNTVDGLRAVEPGLLRLMKTMGASPLQLLRLGRFPAALPFLFSGLKVAAALSVIGAVFAEWVGSSEGLGHLILVFNNATDTAAMFATIFLLSLIGIALFGLVVVCERLLLPWYRER